MKNKLLLLTFLVAVVLPEIGYSDQCRARCSDGSISSSYDCNTVPDSSICRSNSGYSAPARDYAAEQRARDAEAERQRQTTDQERQRVETARRKIQEEAERQEKFIQERDAAASSLKGSTGTTTVQLKGISSNTEPPQLKGSGDAGTGSLKGSIAAAGVNTHRKNKTACPPLQDSSVVDACNVSSGLPTSVENAIAAAYIDAPPGVSDRVRKGFQAVATHDWKLAKAWFEDALNHDPNNAGLKRLVELADYTEKHMRRGNTDKPGHRSSHRTPVQLPEDSDIQYLFPGLNPAQANPSSTATGTSAPTSHSDSALELLFPGLPALEAKELNDYMFDQAIKMTENDPLLIKASNRPGYKKPKILHN